MVILVVWLYCIWIRLVGIILRRQEQLAQTKFREKHESSILFILGYWVLLTVLTINHRANYQLKALNKNPMVSEPQVIYILILPCVPSSHLVV